ncbi:putative Thioredoxin [Trypanosoma vivax]|uniref:Thioredoxin domain-containing protein n=1 Tax=Trypanosoma vivax (strain Y486) TaxID=1055687 RepID=G0U646_TRYVY|nr:hypothetical protein TRVL_06441 [Trypanosoma vivax]KAH8608117.1 putative Thioredoxin [Trypanosoma vivax]CCC51348.1 conserved hypothetical protein [Trypanosoma vivax Y486]
MQTEGKGKGAPLCQVGAKSYADVTPGKKRLRDDTASPGGGDCGSALSCEQSLGEGAACHSHDVRKELDVDKTDRPDVGARVGLLRGTAPHALPPSTSGTVTFLYSLAQLRELFCAPSLQDSSSSVAMRDHRLNPGESVIVIVCMDEAEIKNLVQDSTREYSSCRIFCVNLSCFSVEGRSDCPHRPAGTPGYGGGGMGGVSVDLESQQKHALKEVYRVLGVTGVRDPSQSSVTLSPPSEIRNTDAKGTEGNEDGRVTTTKGPAFHNSAEPGSVDDERGATQEVLTHPFMVLWRAPGALPDECVDQCGDGTVNKEPGTIAPGGPLLVKHLTSVEHLHSLSLFTPVYTVEHLIRTIARKLDSVPVASALSCSYTLVYFGASWCPPCMRAVASLPDMIKSDFPESIECMVKADMDFATPIFKFFEVEIIPVFMILNNNVLRVADGWSEVLNDYNQVDRTKGVAMAALSDVLLRSEVGRIQNSSRASVRAFIDKLTKKLSFDADF